MHLVRLTIGRDGLQKWKLMVSGERRELLQTAIGMDEHLIRICDVPEKVVKCRSGIAEIDVLAQALRVHAELLALGEPHFNEGADDKQPHRRSKPRQQ